MEIVYSVDGLRDYLDARSAAGADGRDDLPRPLPRGLDRGRRRRALRRRRTSWIAGIMQHVEEAGIHSGDSACVLPPHSLGDGDARADPRADAPGSRGRSASSACSTSSSRSTASERPARDRGQPARLADGAVRLQGDRPAARQARLPDHARRAARRPRPARRHRATAHVCVKEAVLPFDRFAGADSLLGPEMRSTGEVMGIARDFPTAFAKAQAAAGADAARPRHGVHHRRRRRQAGRRPGSPRCCTTSASGSSPPAARPRRSAADGHPGRARSTRSARARRTSSTGSSAARSTSSSTRRSAPARAPTATRSARPRSPAGSRASRRWPAGWPRPARSPRRAAASREVVSLQEIHARDGG